jgi:glycosyltransferase involved in cell wall biosynthesis
MFTVTLPPVDYRDPWAQPVEDRLRALTRPGAARRVAYFYETPDTSTFRYRVHNMVQALEGEPDIAAAWFTRQEIGRFLPLLDRCDALVVCRVRYCEQVAHLLSRARSLGVVTIFDCDDLVFDPAYVHLVLYTLDQPLFSKAWDHWFAMIGRIGATLRLCERAIATNAFLAERMRAAAPEVDVRVVPNFLDREQLAISQRLFEAKAAAGFARDGRVHLGYFSGTPTHAKDFALVAGALADILRRDRRIVLRLVGFMEPHAALAPFADRIETFPLQDFLNLQRLIAEVEFNLVPLQQNDFTNCKSELKYFEAAIVGTLTLASPTYAYRAAIRDGDNGWLVPAYAWRDRIDAAVAALDTYPVMAEHAFRDALSEYSPAAMASVIRDALFQPRSDIRVAQLRSGQGSFCQG